jgi:RNA polymerase sigma-70 factor (ECF subfamily)
LLFGDDRHLEVPDRRRSVEDKYIQNEIEASVRKVIAAMKPKLRMAILLKYFDDLSYDEIAVALNCSRGTVASRLNRAHEILAQKLSHLRGAFVSGE